jgi:hypothetical protein
MESEDRASMFVVRMWPEALPGSAPQWRGSVDDVLRKRRIYFTNLGSMCELMVEQRRLAAPPPEEK